MFRKFFAKRLSKVILITAVFGLLVFLNPHNFFNPVRGGLLRITYPFQKIFYFFSIKVSGTRDFVSSIGELKRENEQLVKENQKILAENAILRDMKRENAVLRDQLQLAPRNKFDLLSATIISQDAYSSGSWIMVDKGSSDGIRQGMPVIVSDGILVGKVDEVFPGTSKVVLITNPQSVVTATDSETEARGIVRGEHGLGLVFDMILQTDVIKTGDEVVTSGASGDVPRGLLVGKIQEVSPSEDRLFQQAIVSPAARFSKLEVVFIIKSPQQ